MKTHQNNTRDRKGERASDKNLNRENLLKCDETE